MERKENSKISLEKFLDNVKNQNISFDIDGVLVNSVEFVVNKFNQEHFTEFVPTDMREFEMVVKWLRQMGYQENYAWEKEQEYWYSELLIEAEINEGVDRMLGLLLEANCGIHVISSRPKVLRSITIEHLSKRLDINPENIHIQASSEMAGVVYKTMMIQKLGISVHFEDMLQHTKMILDNTDNTQIICLSNLTWPYDESYFNRITKVEGRTSLDMPNFQDVIKRLSK